MPNDLKEIKDSGLRNILRRLDKKISSQNIESEAKRIGKEIESKIAPKGKLKPVQSYFSFAPVPTNLCRVSPFFPIAKQNLRDREYIQDMIITDSSWGQIKYTGAKLSVNDEDVLIAVLAILNNVKNRKVSKLEGGSFSYTYRGSLLPVLKLMGVKGAGKRDYLRVMKSLKLLLGAVVELIIYRRSSTGKREIEKTAMTNLLSFAEYDHIKKKLIVTVNPYFYECLTKESVTLIDCIKRAGLRSPVSKSLFRFIQSHRSNLWEGHFLTLASTLNLDMELQRFKLRDRIKKATKELIENSVLMDGSGFIKSDIEVVRLIRVPVEKGFKKRLTN